MVKRTIGQSFEMKHKFTIAQLKLFKRSLSETKLIAEHDRENDILAIRPKNMVDFVTRLVANGIRNLEYTQKVLDYLHKGTDKRIRFKYERTFDPRTIRRTRKTA